MEWGISWNEYQKTPYKVINEIKEYLEAKQEGMARKQNRDAKMQKLKNRSNKR